LYNKKKKGRNFRRKLVRAKKKPHTVTHHTEYPYSLSLLPPESLPTALKEATTSFS